MSNLTSNWVYDESESQYWTNYEGFTVYSYKAQSSITEIVDEQEISSNVEVYYTFGINPETNGTPIDHVIRPCGFFVGQIYRKLEDTALTSYDEIYDYFESIDLLSYLPDLTNFQSLTLELRDYSENQQLIDAFAAKGYYLYSYYQLTISYSNPGLTNRISKTIRDDLNTTGYYNVTFDESTYELNAEPIIAKFIEDEMIPMQILGAPLKNDENVIYAYQLLIISIEAL